MHETVTAAALDQAPRATRKGASRRKADRSHDHSGKPTSRQALVKAPNTAGSRPAAAFPFRDAPAAELGDNLA